MDSWLKNEILWKIRDTIPQKDLLAFNSLPQCEGGKLIGFDVPSAKRQTSTYTEFMKKCLKEKKGKEKMKECAEEFKKTRLASTSSSSLPTS